MLVFKTGVALAKGPENVFPFHPVFALLGVMADLRECPKGMVKFTNKRSRVLTTLKASGSLEREQACEPVVAKHLCGKLEYVQGQHFPVCSAICFRSLRQRVGCPKEVVALTFELRESFEWIRMFFTAARPRIISTRDPAEPVIIFTDGAVEDEGRKVIVGAVLLDHTVCAPQLFGLQVPDLVVGLWSGRSNKQVIAQAEHLPVLLARLTWHGVLRGRRVLWFIDNGRARWGQIKGYSPSLTCAHLIAQPAVLEVKAQSMSWFSRVPSISNVADPASRLDPCGVKAVLPDAHQVEVVVPNWFGQPLWQVLGIGAARDIWGGEVRCPGVGSGSVRFPGTA